MALPEEAGGRVTASSLSDTQRELVAGLTQRLSRVRGVLAVVLGGSHARPDSDIDLALLYRRSSPLDLEQVRAIARG